MTTKETEYEGWKNYATWNVSLWLNNEYGIYKGKRPYIDFCIEVGLDTQYTADRIKWVSDKLDYTALNEMMRELVE